MTLVAMKLSEASMDRDDLLDALAELQHDLGKYLVMPLAFLPADAGDSEVRVALRRALTETRRGAAGVRTARGMWTEFEAEVGETLDSRPGMRRLRKAVEVALGWEERLEAAPLDRAAARTDLAEVGEAIRDLIEEVRSG